MRLIPGPLILLLGSLGAVAITAPETLAQADAQVEQGSGTPAPGPLPGHSVHGEAFDEGPRRAAYLMGGTGKVRFPVTTKSPLAQQFVEQGVGQLHGFWYFEAERSFRQAASLDPDCAMAYWGMAMANASNEKRAKEFIKEAAKRKGAVTRREQLWIDTLHDFYHGTEKDAAKRARGYIRGLEAIVQEFPEDVEAKAFLAWKIWDSNGRLPITSHQAVDALLDQVFQADPMHPAHHYRIHLWDNEKPARAVASAARAGQSSPSIAHMWHMPGHTYSKLKRYEDAAFQQEASARVDHARMVRDRVMPYQIHNYAHNNEWLVRNLVFLGRVNDALDLAKNLAELPRHPKLNDPKKGGSGAALGRDRVMDVLTTHQMWDELIALSDTVYLTGDETPDQQLRRLRYLGVAYYAKGNGEKGAEQIAALEALQAKPQGGGEEKAADEKKAEENKEGGAKPDQPSTQPNRRGGRGRGQDRAKQVEKALAHVRGQQALSAGDYQTALDQFAKADDIRKEHLSLAHLQAGDKAKAEQLAKEAAAGDKNEAYPLANYVEVLYLCGKKDEAAEALRQLRHVSSQIDLTAPPYARLTPIAREFGYPADWRLPRTLPNDILPRPALDDLGPFRWHPSPAPSWSLPTADGRTVSLPDYRGRPVLVVFYLGYGCLHCVEQLNAFAPVAKDFGDAGVSIVAVSTDSADGLERSLATCKAEGGYPFPLVSDEGLGAFKAYHAYDDFERMPLHGTFLVDARGLVRWQDVSYQPFTDARFLLAECKRLLAQPAN